MTYGFQTVVAVPLITGNQQYGVLLVHLGGIDSLGDSEHEVFAELGETIGHAIRSVERTRAMITTAASRSNSSVGTIDCCSTASASTSTAA